MPSCRVMSVEATSKAPDAASIWPVIDFTAVAGTLVALAPKTFLNA